MSIERSGQMTAQDTLRWGDQATFLLKPGFREGFATPSKQLILARWRWPMSWKLMFVVVTQLGANETGTFDVDFQVTVGCGGGTTTFSLGRLVAIAASGTSVQFFDIPAQEFNVIATVTAHNIATTTQDNFTIGAYAAPWTESHAVTGLHDHLTRGADERVDQWMREGFYPEPLGYHR